MAEVIEVKIRISNPEQRYVKKVLCYKPISVSREDAILHAMVEEAIKEFDGEVEDVDVKISMGW